MKNTTTIKDIASKAGVSTATVSRYLNNGYISNELQNRVRDVVEELDYVPNQVAISLKTTATQIIGIVIPELSNVSFMDTVKAISEVVTAKGYQPIILSSGESPEKEHHILDVLISRRVDGLIIAAADTSGDKILRINSTRLPVVEFDRDVCNSGNKIIVDAVVNDNFGGAYQMISYLLSLGHRDIAVLASNMAQEHLQQRLDGYCQALADRGIPTNDSLIAKGDLDFQSGYAMTKGLLALSDPRPTAIFSLNNMAALGAVSALHELHVSIPEQMSVCGFGEFKYHTVLTPDLTVVNQCPYDLGRQAAEILMEKIEAHGPWLPRKVVLPANLIFRDSCAAPIHSAKDNGRL